MNRKRINIIYLLIMIITLDVITTFGSETDFLESKKNLTNWVTKNLAPRLEGLKGSNFVLPKSKIHLIYAPNRNKPLPISLESPIPLSCPFDEPEKFLPPYFEFGDTHFLLYPNIMPYAKDHLLLIAKRNELSSAPHYTQDSMLFFLEEIFKIKEMAKEDSLFFNHFAGNSLTHLHIHLTSEKTDLEKNILTLLEIFSVSNSLKHPIWFSLNSCQKGFIFIDSSKNQIIRNIKNIVTILKTNGYLYNFFIFPKIKTSNEDKYFAIVIPRIKINTGFKNQNELSNLNISPTLSSYDLVQGKVIYNREKNILNLLPQIDELVLDLCQKTVLQDPSVLPRFTSFQYLESL